MKKTAEFNQRLVDAFWDQETVEANGKTYHLPTRQTGGNWGQNSAYDGLVARNLREGNYKSNKVSKGVRRISISNL